MRNNRARSRSPDWKPAWRSICIASFFLAAVIVLAPSLQWPSLGDDGYYFYNQGLKPWGELLWNTFFPPDFRIFVFGEDRPVQRLFFKIMYELGASPSGFRMTNWVLDWLGCAGFGWGMEALLRRGLKLRPGAGWLIATLCWWSPASLMSAIGNLDQFWVLGACGAFWALYLGGDPGALPGFLATRPRLRLPLAFLCALLACQMHETAWILLGWSSLWLLAAMLAKGGLSAKGGLRDRRELAVALAPVAIAILHVLLYRSFDPLTANRYEVAVSAESGSLLRVAKHYLEMGFYAVSEPFHGWLGLPPTAVGITPTSFPWGFLLTTAGAGWAIVAVWKKTSRQQKAMAGLILAGGLLLTIPYLLISNRQLLYYSGPLNAFTSAALVAWIFLERKGEARSWFGLEPPAVLYAAGVAVAGTLGLTGWNYLQHWSGGTLELTRRVLSIPGASACSSESPCCVVIPGEDWAYNVWVVNWNVGLPRPPAFVRPGMPCSRTLELR